MKVVLDSNVIIAAFATKGLCSKIFEFCIFTQEIITSDYILTEIERILLDKLKMPSEKVKERIEFIKSIAKLVSPVKVEEHICKDKNDLPIIGTAIAGEAEVIVTGDTDLIEIQEYRNIKFLSPRDFLNFINIKEQRL